MSSLYLSSLEGSHDQDEIDFEFLGKDNSKVQTNYYVYGYDLSNAWIYKSECRLYDAAASVYHLMMVELPVHSHHNAGKEATRSITILALTPVSPSISTPLSIPSLAFSRFIVPFSASSNDCSSSLSHAQVAC